MNATNSNVISNVKINNIDVSGLFKEQIEEAFKGFINDIMNESISLKHKEHETTITLKQVELKANIQDTVFEACRIGRDSNIIANNYITIKTYIFGKNLDLDFTFNEDIMRKYI